LDRSIDGRTDGQTDGWIDGYKNFVCKSANAFDRRRLISF